MNKIRGIEGVVVLFLLAMASISSATLTLTDTSITESDDYLALSAGERVNITSGTIFSGAVIEGCKFSYPMVRIGHHGPALESPVIFLDDSATSWGIDLLGATDTFRIFKPANAIFTLTDSMATIDVDLDVTGNGSFTGNVTADNVWIPAYAFAHCRNNISVDSAGVWYNITFNESATFNQSITHNHADSTNDTFTIVDTGIYDLHGHLSFQDSAVTPDSNVVFRFTKNDVEIAGSIREYDLDKKDRDTLGSTTVFVNLTAGDEIKLQFTSDDTTVCLESDNTYGVHKDTAVIKIKRIS